MQQAVADNDFRRTQALLADYQQRYQQQLQTAQNLAKYGDFSGYAGLPGYSQEQIGRMQSAWAASNPKLAYNTGAITADQYYAMTGKWPVGYSAPGGGGWGDYTPTAPTTEQPAGALDEYRNGVQLYNYGEQIGPTLPGSGNGGNRSTGSGPRVANAASSRPSSFLTTGGLMQTPDKMAAMNQSIAGWKQAGATDAEISALLKRYYGD